MAQTFNTRTIAVGGMLAACSLIVSFIQIPIFPAAPWLSYDPSGVICVIAALAFGPKLGVAVAVISWLPHFFFNPFGMIMGTLNTVSFVLPAALIYTKAKQSRAASLLGMIVGALLAIAVSCAANLIITPLYTSVTLMQTAAMILPILLPFNALKMLINLVMGQMLLAPCMNVLAAHRS
ncbi:ECF transporter S component [Collinsella sp. zg1085]|uniref:ECF transporter S component n=1 Tax=Collinsella sp. zg1085 TaxID=2844380 RepID=UPI001C0E07B6|nr:ECF transporter S component [Collinsella sp. zg1085]QWT17739.1 ECF transporter S component [Collinsella sp. zg1085]